MEESLTDTSNSSIGPHGETKGESVSEAYSQDNLLYGNETESLVTDKLFSQTKQNIKIGGANNHSDDNDDDKSNSNRAPLLQPRCLKTSVNNSLNEVTVTEADVIDHQALPQPHVENENKLVNELEADFSGSESDRLETSLPHEKYEDAPGKSDSNLSEQCTKPKSQPALLLVAEYADSGNDTEEELQLIKNPVVPLGILYKKQSIEDCSENTHQKASKSDDQITNVGFDKTTTESILCSPVKDITQATANSSEHFSVLSQETTCLQLSHSGNAKEWSENGEKKSHSELEVGEKMEIESSSDSVDENDDQLTFMDLNSKKVKKMKDSESKEKKHKKKKKKKTKKASSNSDKHDGIEREKRKESKSSHKDRSRQDSSSYSEERNKNYHSEDSAAELKRQNHRDKKRSRSRSRTRSPRRKHRHRSRSQSRNRSYSSSKRRRHSRSRSHDRSSRRSRYSPSSRRKSYRRSRSYSRSRSRSRGQHHDRDSKSSSSHRKRERSHEKLSEKGSRRSSRERSSERKKSHSPQRRYSSDSNLIRKKEKQSPQQQLYKPLPTAVTSMSEEEKQNSEETKLASEKSSEEQTSSEKPNKKVNTSPKTENSDEELWAELEHLTYSSSSTANQKSGYQVEKPDSKMRGKDKPMKPGGDVPAGSVKDDILPLVSTPASPNQEEFRRNKKENVKNVASKSAGHSFWKPLKQSFDSSKMDAEQDSKADEEPLVVTASNEPVISATDMSSDKRSSGSNNDAQSSDELCEKADKVSLSVNQQQNLDIQTQCEDSQLSAESNAPSDSLQDANVQKSPRDEQKVIEMKTSPTHDLQSSVTEQRTELSEDGKPAQQEATPCQTLEENAESKSNFESPPKSQIKPFISQFNQMHPTVIPGLDLMNPNFTSPPPPPPFSRGVMNTPTKVVLPPPPFPPWARFPPTPGQHQLPPPPPFPPAHVPPPSLLPLRMQQPPPWGGTHLQQNVPNLSTQNQNSVNQPFFPSQATEFKMAPPVLESGTSAALQRQVELAEKTEDTETEQEMPKEQIESLDNSILEADGSQSNHRNDSVSSPVDMEMSSPEGDIIDKLNEEFWESQQMNNQEAEEVDKVTLKEENAFVELKASSTTPPPQGCAVSPPYSPRGEVVNLNVPEVLKLKQERRPNKEKSSKKKAKLSAKSLSMIDRIHRQARVEEEAKHVLRIYYKHRDVNKEEYKTILRKIVPQVTNSNHSIDPERIRHLVKKYVAKIKGQRLLKQNER